MSNDIDVSGTLQNMLEDGFNERDALSELIDNSFGANATIIKFIFNTATKDGYCIDNGIGMNMEGLKWAIRLNGRSPASNNKQGKFGTGLPHALAVQTQLQNSITILSSPMNDVDLYNDEDDCEVNLYDDESLYVNASEAVAVSKPIGDKIVIIKSSSERAHIDPNYDDESLYVNASEAAALARGPKTTVSAIGKYTTTFGELDSERSYKLINKALGFKALRDGCDTYTADNYTIMMDYSMMYVHFISVEDTEYVRGVITMIAEALGDEPEHHFELYNEETNDYVNI